MPRCKNCGRSGVLLRTDRRGLCTTCRSEIQQRVGEERERIKEALICIRYLKDGRDRHLHVQRALNAVRVLARYESLGFLHMKPDSRTLAAMVEAQLGELGGETSAPSPGAKSPYGLPLRQSSPPTGRDRRVSGRSPARLWVRLDDGLRARTEDVSRFGVRLRTVHPRRPGSRLRCRVDSPRGPVVTEGVVRWAHLTASRGSQAEMGIQFAIPVLELEMYG